MNIETELIKFNSVIDAWIEWLSNQDAYTLLVLAFLVFFVSLFWISKNGESIQ